MSAAWQMRARASGERAVAPAQVKAASPAQTQHGRGAKPRARHAQRGELSTTCAGIAAANAAQLVARAEVGGPQN